MPNLRDDHLLPIGHLTPVYPTLNFFISNIFVRLELDVHFDAVNG
jgi:hypothetical protein